MDKQAGSPAGPFSRSKEIFNPAMTKPKAIELPTPPSVFNLNLGTNLEGFRKARKELADLSTSASNNLARNEALDLTLKESEVPGRILVYPRSEEDDRIHLIFEGNGITHFPRISFSPNPDLTVLRIPESAYRLDSIVLSEQEETQGSHTGALEIMKQLGNLLNKMRKATSMLPTNFQLCEVAFATGDINFIKLIPPYSFSSDITTNQVIDALTQQINSLDPDHPHGSQIDSFAKELYKII